MASVEKPGFSAAIKAFLQLVFDFDKKVCG
jgi:hypothetical protein